LGLVSKKCLGIDNANWKRDKKKDRVSAHE